MSAADEFLLNPAVYDDIFTLVMDRVHSTVLDLIDASQDDDGRVAGQVPLKREDRILWTFDFIQSGAMQWLTVINPGVAKKLQRDFDRDLAAGGIEVPDVVA